MGAAKAARKPNLQPRTETDGKKRTERYGIPKFRRFRKSLATSSPRLSCSLMEALLERKPKIPMEVNALPSPLSNIATRYSEMEDMHLEDHHQRLRLLGSIRDDTVHVTKEANRQMMQWYNRCIQSHIF